MITRQEAKMFFDSDLEVLEKAFDSDLEVLEKAFDSDKEYADITQKAISVSVSKIYEILIQKGILTMEEVLEHLKEVEKIMQEETNKMNRKEIEKDDN